MGAESVRKSQGMKRVCDWYIRNAVILGVVYAVVPSLIWYGAGLASGQFRAVYLLRLAVALVAGGAVGAFVNHFGVSLWIIKHRSVKGPGTLLDGAAIGAGVGLGCSLVPPLTALIQSSDPEYAKAVIIAAWVAAAALGALVGLVLAGGGRQYVHREWPAEEAQAS